MNKLLTFVCFAIFVVGFAFYADAQPNLAQAQSLIDKAYAKISDAQKAKEFDLGGHAAKAKDFLEQASKELKLAASAAGDHNASENTNEQKTRKNTSELATNIGSKKHPNLAEAQKLISDAYARVNAAQKANEFDLGGHAAKAKGFLEQASQELKLAAVSANK
jgi:exonuclease VII small subunit